MRVAGESARRTLRHGLRLQAPRLQPELHIIVVGVIEVDRVDQAEGLRRTVDGVERADAGSEGQDLARERAAINERIAKRPDESPGVSPHSGEEGESFNQARARLIGGVRQQAAGMGPDDAALNITSGRALQIVDAWGKNGQPADGSVDTGEITAEKGEFSKPGQLFRLGAGGLEPVAEVKGPGQFFGQHGETEWNRASGGTVSGLSGTQAGAGPAKGEAGWVGNIPTSEIQVDAPRGRRRRRARLPAVPARPGPEPTAALSICEVAALFGSARLSGISGR